MSVILRLSDTSPSPRVSSPLAGLVIFLQMSPSPDPRDLTDLQLAILSLLWDREEASVAELHEALADRAGASRKTVATLLDRLEKRGFVRHRSRERENVYRAAVPRRRVMVDRMASLLGALFPTADVPVGARALSRDEVHEGDVEALLALLKRARRDLESGE